MAEFYSQVPKTRPIVVVGVDLGLKNGPKTWFYIFYSLRA